MTPFLLYAEEDTFDIGRIHIIRLLIHDIIERKTKGLRTTTVREQVQFYIRFIDWVDKNNYSITTIDNAHTAYFQYSNYLQKRISLYKNITSTSAERLQSASLKILKMIFNDRIGVIDLGVNPITKEFRRSAGPLDINKLSYAIKFYYNLFHQISDFLLQHKPYPFQLDLPNEKLWVWCGSPWILPKHKKKTVSRIFFNYDLGQIRQESEVAQLSNSTKVKMRSNLNNVKKMLVDNNNDKLLARYDLGTIAAKAFYMLFLFIVGANDSVASTLLWHKDFKKESGRKGFKNIKYRAKGKVVEFEIQREFIEDFHKYLNLRSYILNGHKCDYLFFTGHTDHAHLSRRQSSGSYSSIINHYFQERLDPNLPIINSRQIRTNKIQFIYKNFGLTVAAKAAQSLKSTVDKYYTHESETTSKKQLSNFFKKFNSKIFDNKEKDKTIAAGQCVHPNSPSSAYPIKLEIEPDCKHAEGCLFCKNYRIHPDEEDIRKLISFKYVIMQSKYISDDKKHFYSIFGTYLDQIDNILNMVIQKYPSLKTTINDIRIDVFEKENLDLYWQYKYESLVHLGVLR